MFPGKGTDIPLLLYAALFSMKGVESLCGLILLLVNLLLYLCSREGHMIT